MNIEMLVVCASIGVAGALSIATMFKAGRSIPRWAFVIGMGLLGLEALLVSLSNAATTPEEIAKWQSWRLVVVTLLPVAWIAFSATYARGKDRLPVNRVTLGALLALILPCIAAVWFREWQVVSAQFTAWETGWRLRWSWSGTVLFIFMLVGSVAVVVNLERSFRASIGAIRWRIKYMLLGVGLIFVVRIYTSSQAVLFQGVDSSTEMINLIALVVGGALTTRSLYRTGHFDLEVYPSRSVLQKSLTVFLAGAYLLIVGILAKVVSYIGGDAAFAVKAFFIMAMVVLLAIVIQSDRARLELRRFVSRNFRRSSYDYREVWKTFTEGTVSRVEQADLCRGLVTLIAETFDALSVSILLVEEKKERLILGASTNSSASSPIASNNGDEVRRDASLVCERFHNQPHPVDIESITDPWADALKIYHPAQFPNGGNRVCVPVIGHGDVLGVIVVGDRVAGIPFSVEDFEMLKCISDHAAASLLNVQLSTKLLQAKELEAFQSMAAFFVHDLKNAASTLNLMLQNFPAHFDNPEFKQDALRGIGKTASHINRLVSRLGMLRHELRVELAEADVNELVSSILAEIEHTPGYIFTKNLGSLPRVKIDRDQIHKVITNLILNATEATAPQGEVRISTGRENGWVVLTVADSGCGMSSEFLRNSLFRPFQTTKKNGLGIGMFQSKMIVEAHRGRIAVASEVGKGTTFQVYLPEAPNS